jgi:hypothetical protein
MITASATATGTAVAGESTYAGIVRLVTAAQTAKAPFVRLADRYALFFLPFTLAVAGFAFLISGDPVRSLAVLVAATPCPLILAAPVAFIAGVAAAARRGILIKGGAPLERLARAHTVLFDKTGTLTVGGARVISIETAPGESADEVLRLGASLEQASQHVLAGAIVQAALARGLPLQMPRQAKETVGAGLTGLIGGKRVSAGSADMILSGPAAASAKASPAFKVPLNTCAPLTLVTGMGSPVNADSSTTPRSCARMPSTGTTSPARTRRESPTATSSTGTSSTPWSTQRCARRGARFTSARKSCSARSTAKSSSTLPPEYISATTAPASGSPKASAALIDKSAITSTPKRTSGLAAGEQVVTDGQYKLEPNAPVVVKASAPPPSPGTM